MPQADFLFLTEFKLVHLSFASGDSQSFQYPFFACSDGVYFWIRAKSSKHHFTQKQNESFLLLNADNHHLFLCEQ